MVVQVAVGFDHFEFAAQHGGCEFLGAGFAAAACNAQNLEIQFCAPCGRQIRKGGEAVFGKEDGSRCGEFLSFIGGIEQHGGCPLFDCLRGEGIAIEVLSAQADVEVSWTDRAGVFVDI